MLTLVMEKVGGEDIGWTDSSMLVAVVCPCGDILLLSLSKGGTHIYSNLQNSCLKNMNQMIDSFHLQAQCSLLFDVFQPEL